MSIPNIRMPLGTPRFQLDGHGIDEQPAYGQVDYAVGHSRLRRVTSVTERVVTVGLFLSKEKLQAFDDWYHIALRAGERQFAAEVKNEGPGTLWWTARWISYQCEMKTKNRGRITGSLLLSGEPSTVAPSGSALSMTVRVDLRDIRSSISLPTDLSMTVAVDLIEAYA